MKPLALALALTATFALAFQAAPVAAQSDAAFEHDRASILAMTGNYKVRFDFRETVPFRADYDPIDDKISGGYEAVRVIEDTGRKISLQHLLVVEDGAKAVVVKHWRQDWIYEPANVLVYEPANRWKLAATSPEARKGAWSQTVWQTDDSPRYGGVGRWRYEGGVTRWQSDETLRPLARRDAIRKPVYGWYVGTNRHALTPEGWVHEQDNAKVGAKDGKAVTFVHEVVLNTYSRSDKFPVKAADDYWAATKGYWAEVRLAWDQAIAKSGGVAVREEAQNGSETGPKLMSLADRIAEGKLQTAAAVTQAKQVIVAETSRQPALASR